MSLLHVVRTDLHGVEKAIHLDDMDHVNQRNRFLVGLGLATLIGFGAAAVVVVGTVLEIADKIEYASSTWNPLGKYSTQEADPEVVVTSGAQAFVHVSATKCFGPDPVRTVGNMSWQAVDPRGAVIRAIEEGQAIRKPGCEQFRYRNPVPEEVVILTAAQPGRTMQWEIAGEEWPVDENGRLGVSRTWISNPITVKVDP